MAKEMLENTFSALRIEDAAITLPLLSPPSTGDEQNSTVDAVHNHPTVAFDFSNTSNTSSITDLSSSHTLKQGELSSSQGKQRRFCWRCHICSSKGILRWTTFFVKSVMLAALKMVQVEEKRATVGMNISV